MCSPGRWSNKEDIGGGGGEGRAGRGVMLTVHGLFGSTSNSTSTRALPSQNDQNGSCLRKNRLRQVDTHSVTYVQERHILSSTSTFRNHLRNRRNSKTAFEIDSDVKNSIKHAFDFSILPWTTMMASTLEIGFQIDFDLEVEYFNDDSL